MRWLRPSRGAVVGLLLLGTCAYVLKQSGSGGGSGSTTAARVEPRPTAHLSDGGQERKRAESHACLIKATGPYVGSVVTALEIVEDRPDTARLQVGLGFQGMTKGQRLTIAKQLWQLWATCNKPNQPSLDGSHLDLISEAGDKVGGSGFAGSLVDVDD